MAHGEQTAHFLRAISPMRYPSIPFGGRPQGETTGGQGTRCCQRQPRSSRPYKTGVIFGLPPAGKGDSR
ncbi:MAG: hypothetical protein R3C62_05530 [Chloroflexota bacterium]